MMKKILLYLVLLLMILSICACSPVGEPNPTKVETTTAPEETTQTAEKMLETATELSRSDVYDSKPWENLARAENEYVGNTYTTSAFFVNEVVTDYAILGEADGYSNVKFKLYLSREELAALNVGEKIQFVGRVESIEKESNVIVIFSMKEAHFVTNRVVISGEYSEMYYKGKNYGVIGTTAITLDSEELKSLKKGENVAIEGVIHYDPDMDFYFTMTSHVFAVMTDAVVK